MLLQCSVQGEMVLCMTSKQIDRFLLSSIAHGIFEYNAVLAGITSSSFKINLYIRSIKNNLGSGPPPRPHQVSTRCAMNGGMGVIDIYREIGIICEGNGGNWKRIQYQFG